MMDSIRVDHYLALTRAALTPPPELRARVQARLEGSALAGPSATEPSATELTAPELGARPFLRLSKGMTLAASGALLALGFATGQALRPASVEPPPLPRIVEPRVVEPRVVELPRGVELPREGETPGGAAAVSGWAHLEPLSEEPLSEEPRTPAAPPPARSSKPAKAPPHELQRGPREELALLQRAERAVRAENSALALSLTAELEARYPRSELLEERRALELLAHCVAHATDSRPRAERFLRDHGRSVYADRITALCFEPERFEPE